MKSKRKQKKKKKFERCQQIKHRLEIVSNLISIDVQTIYIYIYMFEFLKMIKAMTRSCLAAG